MNNKVFIYLGYAMALVYCTSGVALVLYGEGLFNMPDWARLLTGCLLIAYGIFRFARSRKMSENE